MERPVIVAPGHSLEGEWGEGAGRTASGRGRRRRNNADGDHQNAGHHLRNEGDTLVKLGTTRYNPVKPSETLLNPVKLGKTQ